MLDEQYAHGRRRLLLLLLLFAGIGAVVPPDADLGRPNQSQDEGGGKSEYCESGGVIIGRVTWGGGCCE